MDAIEHYKKEYEALTAKLTTVLPFNANPTRELVQALKNSDTPITLATELKIKSVLNTGDISGIICECEGGLACGLTHLIFSPDHPLYSEILDYQKKRAKRIQKLNSIF